MFGFAPAACPGRNGEVCGLLLCKDIVDEQLARADTEHQRFAVGRKRARRARRRRGAEKRLYRIFRSGIAMEDIAAIPAPELIVATLAVQGVAVGIAIEDIIAQAAAQHVNAGSAAQVVVSRCTLQLVASALPQ
jgi:hypothetical protein